MSFLDALTHPAQLCEPATDGAVRCLACAHRCLVRPGRRGVCGVRFHDGEGLRAPYGYVAALHTDPVEKKPFFHFLPGARALTFGMLGCDFHCAYCQNWEISQAFRDPAAAEAQGYIQRVSPAQLVQAAQRTGAEIVVSSYNEPLITTEWAVHVFEAARAAGLRTAFVSNGNATPEALTFLRPWLDAYKVDLKSMQAANYRQLGGVLQHVLDTIEKAHALGLWVEVVTLVVPGFNDSTEELWQAARFLAGVSPDIPWHVTSFHPDYKMTDRERTPAESLIRAAELGREAGLRYVYAGNLPGRVEHYEDTLCPQCGATLVTRHGFQVHSPAPLGLRGICPRCGAQAAGLWRI